MKKTVALSARFLPGACIGLALLVTDSSLLAATAVQSVQPNRISIAPGQSVTVTLNGTDLDQVSKILVYENRSPSRNVTARFVGATSSTKGRLEITAKPGARPGGAYDLALIGSGNKPVRISSSVMQLGVVAGNTGNAVSKAGPQGPGSAAAGLTPQAVAPRPATVPKTAPEMTPPSPTAAVQEIKPAGGTAVKKPRPGDDAIAGGAGQGVSGGGTNAKTIRDGQDAKVNELLQGQDAKLNEMKQGPNIDSLLSQGDPAPGGGGGTPTPNHTSQGIGPGSGLAGGSLPGDKDHGQSGGANDLPGGLPSVGKGSDSNPLGDREMGSTASGQFVGAGGQLFGSREEAAISRVTGKAGQYSEEPGATDQNTSDATSDDSGASAKEIIFAGVTTATGTADVFVAGVEILTAAGVTFAEGGVVATAAAAMAPVAAVATVALFIGGAAYAVYEYNKDDSTPNPMNDFSGPGSSGGVAGSAASASPCIDKECTEESMVGRPEITEAQATQAGRMRLNQLINPGDHGGEVAPVQVPAGVSPDPVGCVNKDCTDPAIQ